MEKTILKISGMHCSSCEKIIEDKLSEIAGISNIKINDDGLGELEAAPEVSDEAIIQAIVKAGYQGTIVNRTHKQTSQAPDTFEKKIVESGAGVKIHLESQIAAEGTFTTDQSHPTFKGIVTHHRSGELEVPKDRSDLNVFVDELLRSTKIHQLHKFRIKHYGLGQASCFLKFMAIDPLILSHCC